MNSNYWLLPPMVGEILNNQVVIVCEVLNKTINIQYSLQGQYPIEVNVDFKGPIRVIIDLKDTAYSAAEGGAQRSAGGKNKLEWFQNGDKIYEHYINNKEYPDKIIFVSCDLPEADVAPQESMWNRMHSELNDNNQTWLLHLGDQVYNDGVFNTQVKLVDERGQNTTVDDEVLNAFRQKYRLTYRIHHEILSQTSNYHIWDDHEIFNDYTYLDQINDTQKYVKDKAVQVYNEYQVSTHLEFNRMLSDYSWFKKVGDLLVVAIERTSRPVIVSELLQMINSLTTPEIKRLILCFSSPPIPGPKKSSYNFLYNWMYNGKFWDKRRLEELYQGVFDWMTLDDDREAAVIGGDLHIGVYGYVRDSISGKSFPLIIASPITNQPSIGKWFCGKKLSGMRKINSTINYNCMIVHSRRNFATIDLTHRPMRVSMQFCNNVLPHSLVKLYKAIRKF